MSKYDIRRCYTHRPTHGSTNKYITSGDDILTDLPTAAQVSMTSGDDIFTDQPTAT